MFLFRLVFASARQEWREDNKAGAVCLGLFGLILAFGICLCLGLLYKLLGDIFTKYPYDPLMIVGGVLLAASLIFLGFAIEKRSKKFLAHSSLKE